MSSVPVTRRDAPAPRAVGLGRGDRPGDDGRVGAQPEVVVAREVEPVAELRRGEAPGQACGFP